VGFIEHHRAVKPLMVISRLARTTFPSLTTRMDCHYVLEKQPGKQTTEW